MNHLINFIRLLQEAESQTRAAEPHELRLGRCEPEASQQSCEDGVERGEPMIAAAV